MLFLISVLIILVAAYFLPRGFGEGNNLLRTFSITSRLTSDLNYLSTYKWDLLWGRGLNTLILEKSDSILPSHATGPNNSYFYLLLTSGVVGLVGWGVFLKELYRESSHQALIMFIVIGSFFNNLMFYPFTLLFMLLAQNKKSKAPTLA